MPLAAVGLWLHTDAPRGREILQLLADFYRLDGIALDDTGNARLSINAPEDIPAYLAVMGALEACAPDWEQYITVLKLTNDTPT
jgi:hypothetical protein